MMFWFVFAIGISQANETTGSSVGMRVEYAPLPDESSGLNNTLNQWMPWLMYTNDKWNLKGSFLVNANSQQSKTSETTDQTVSSQMLLALEGERVVSFDDLDWTIGFGLHNNLPIVRQYSSQFTEEEQKDIDTQTQNQQADLSFTRLRIPCTVQVPIRKHLEVGLGFQISYTIQRSQSDFTTYLNTSWYTSPILTLQMR